MTGDNRLPVLADEIRQEHSDALEASAAATRHAIKAGRLLIEAKSSVPHGGWLAWLKDNCQLSERTAQRYMRLAAKVPELDPENATRESDLPIREALKAIADQGAEVALPPAGSDFGTVWAWAERQVTAPFNRFDADSKDGVLVRNKLCAQVGVSASMTMLLDMSLDMSCDEIPTLRLASDADIVETLRTMAPIARDLADCYALDFDEGSLGPQRLAFLAQLVRIEAEIICGRLLQEINYREKHGNLHTPDGVRTAIEEQNATSGYLVQWCEKRLADHRAGGRA